MAGTGRAPKPPAVRKNTTAPSRGEWVQTDKTGWQHGDFPKPPTALKKVSRETWGTWFKAWYAAHWTPEDLPGLVVVIQLYDQVQRGEYQRANELRLQMDSWGITKKGQQDRRWMPPAAADDAESPKKRSSRRDHLRIAR